MKTDDDREREHFERISAARPLTRNEMESYLMIGAGYTPCSRYGYHSADMVDLVIRCHEIMEECNGPTDDLASLDGLMSMAVNDSVGPLALIARHGTDEDRETYRDEILGNLADLAGEGDGIAVDLSASASGQDEYRETFSPDDILVSSNELDVFVFWHAGAFTPGAVRLVVASDFGDAEDEYLANESVEAFYAIDDDDLADYNADDLTYNDNGTAVDTDWLRGRELRLSDITFE